jgi:hypothetical protein
MAAGVYGMVRARRVAEAFTPDGIRDRVKAVGLGARMLRDEVAQGTADAETGLRRRYGLPPAEEIHPALEARPPTRPSIQSQTHEPTNDPKDNR